MYINYLLIEKDFFIILKMSLLLIGGQQKYAFFSTVKSPLTIAPFRVVVKNAESALFVFDINVSQQKRKC